MPADTEKSQARKPLRVLVVEDAREDLLLLLLKLRSGAYDLTYECVCTAVEMAQSLRDRQWDLVISDYVMPQFSGLDALQTLKNSGLDLPFIMVSGQIDQETAVRAMRAGAHDYFNKGDLGMLVPAIERELREADVRRQRRAAQDALEEALSSLEIRIQERTAELEQAYASLQEEAAGHKRAAQALRETNRLLQAAARIIETSPDLIAMLNRDHVYTMANPTYARFHGREATEILGLHTWDVLGEDVYRRLARPSLARCFTGEEVSFEEWYDFSGVGRRFVRVAYYPLFDGPEVEQAVVVIRDVTEQKKADEQRDLFVAEMRALNERLVLSGISAREQAEAADRRAVELDAAFSAIGDGIVLYGPSGEIVRMNDMAAEILEHSPGDVNKPIAERLARYDTETMDGVPVPVKDMPAMKALRGETVRGMTLVFHPHSPKRRSVSVTAGPIRGSDGQITGAIASFTDITSLHNLQEERESYVHTISHDLRNPLTVITGHASYLKRALQKNGSSGQAARSAQFILSAAGRLNSMIQDIVDCARLEAGGLNLDLKPVDLRSLVTEMLEERGRLLEWKGVSAELPEDLPPVHADPQSVERIVLNLVTNSIKYSGQKKVIIRAALRDGAVRVSVCDRGRGIEPDDLPHIFQRFYRAANSQPAGGAGLGLYITRLLVEAQGGTIEAESRPGKGSTFQFTLPLA